MTSRYLRSFQELSEKHADDMQLQGDVLIVEEVEKEEVKSAGGIILQESPRSQDGFGQNRPTLLYVLASGPGYFKDDGSTVACTAQPGDLILTGATSIKWLSHFGPIVATQGARIGLARDEDVQILFKKQEGYDRVFFCLQATNATNVATNQRAGCLK